MFNPCPKPTRNKLTPHMKLRLLKSFDNAIFKRDHDECIMCLLNPIPDVDKFLVGNVNHHIDKRWGEKLFDEMNGICICKNHHFKLHHCSGDEWNLLEWRKLFKDYVNKLYGRTK